MRRYSLQWTSERGRGRGRERDVGKEGMRGQGWGGGLEIGKGMWVRGEEEGSGKGGDEIGVKKTGLGEM